jgi:hypothetical protein
VTPPANTLSGPSASPSGYRLSGSDMSSWIGRRVQIVGTLAPTTTANTFAAGADPSSRFQEFRVQSVVPLTGPCPQP